MTSLIPKGKNGAAVWAAILVPVLIVIVGALVATMSDAATTEEKVKTHEKAIEEFRKEQKIHGEQLAGINVSLKGFAEDLKEIKRAVK